MHKELGYRVVNFDEFQDTPIGSFLTMGPAMFAIAQVSGGGGGGDSAMLTCITNYDIKMLRTELHGLKS